MDLRSAVNTTDKFDLLKFGKRIVFGKPVKNTEILEDHLARIK
jgi:hypothetical protein